MMLASVVIKSGFMKIDWRKGQQCNYCKIIFLTQCEGQGLQNNSLLFLFWCIGQIMFYASDIDNIGSLFLSNSTNKNVNCKTILGYFCSEAKVRSWCRPRPGCWSSGCVQLYNGNSIKTFRLVKHFAKNVKKKHKKHTQAVRVALYNGNYIKHLCLKMFCKKPTNADQVAVYSGNVKT